MASPRREATRQRSATGAGPNIGIVTAYNDMLSAHQPYARYPEQMKIFAREVGATAQVAGGMPAMCDGVTQGQDGMELSLFSRDVDRAVDRGRAQPRDVRRRGAARHLRQDRARAADRRAALRPPADDLRARRADADRASPTRRSSGSASSMPRARSAAPSCSRARAASYHSPGTCTFYGTANSNQMMMELMGLHVPGAAFVNPGTPLRQALTRAAVHRLAAIGRAATTTARSAACVDEKAIVNADGRAAGDRRLDQPRDPPAGDRARGGDR